MKQPQEDWRDAFKSHSLRVGFQVSLTRSMLEFLCAVADDVVWDRFAHGSTVARPDNFMASSRSLEKRGLIRWKTDAARPRWTHTYEIRAHHELTPAGQAVVQLCKMAGLYLEADASIERRSRRA